MFTYDVSIIVHDPRSRTSVRRQYIMELPAEPTLPHTLGFVETLIINNVGFIYGNLQDARFTFVRDERLELDPARVPE